MAKSHATYSFRVTSGVETFAAAEVIGICRGYDENLADAAVYSPDCLILVRQLVFRVLTL